MVGIVGVVVVAVVGFALHAVEDNTFDVDVVLFEAFDAGFKLSCTRVRITANHKDGAGMLADDDGVGNGQYGRRVQDDIIVALARVGEQFVETVVHQKLGRIARIAAAADKVEVFNAGLLYGFCRSCFAVEDVRQAELGGKAEESVEVAFAHIGIDKQNAFA